MELKLKLDAENEKQFLAVKESYGVQSNLSAVQHLISREYRRIQRSKVRKVFLPNETYDLMEQVAEARNQTVDEYVQEITEDLLKEARKNPEAFKRGEHRETEN